MHVPWVDLQVRAAKQVRVLGHDIAGDVQPGNAQRDHLVCTFNALACGAARHRGAGRGHGNAHCSAVRLAMPCMLTGAAGLGHDYAAACPVVPVDVLYCRLPYTTKLAPPKQHPQLGHNTGAGEPVNQAISRIACRLGCIINTSVSCQQKKPDAAAHVTTPVTCILLSLLKCSWNTRWGLLSSPSSLTGTRHTKLLPFTLQRAGQCGHTQGAA